MKTKQIKQHLSFNFKERLAFIVLLLIIAIIFAYPFLFNKKDEQPLTIIKSSNQNEEKNEPGNERKEYYKEENDKSYYNDRPKQTIKLFPFNPNTASFEDWQSLGLRDRTIKTIKNYLSKGGQFRKKEDLKKIYGLHEEDYNRLEPFINIPQNGRTNSYTTSSYTSFKEEKPKPVKETKNLTIEDINTADANAFIALPGIGEKLSARIINFRDKLGGFHSIEQVKETYGLPDSTFQSIKQYLKLGSAVKKLNINTATKDELKTHPYIRWSIANAIVEYRNQHGNYKSLEELKNIVVIDEASYRKIVPYLGL